MSITKVTAKTAATGFFKTLNESIKSIINGENKQTIIIVLNTIMSLTIMLNPFR